MSELDELILHIVEECGEVVQAYAKCQRFGPLNHHPKLEPHFTNIDHLGEELAQLHNLIDEYWDKSGW